MKGYKVKNERERERENQKGKTKRNMAKKIRSSTLGREGGRS